jgi:hypothetical protein
MDSALALLPAKLFEFQLGYTLSSAGACAVVSLAALTALKPNILPFTFLFSHSSLFLPGVSVCLTSPAYFAFICTDTLCLMRAPLLWRSHLSSCCEMLRQES